MSAEIGGPRTGGRASRSSSYNGRPSLEDALARATGEVSRDGPRVRRSGSHFDVCKQDSPRSYECVREEKRGW